MELGEGVVVEEEAEEGGRVCNFKNNNR